MPESPEIQPMHGSLPYGRNGDPGATRARFAIVGLWVVLVLVLLPVREVMTPDEARFIQQASEMRESGRWFVPTLGGVVHTDKPPVLFWAIDLAAAWQPRIGEAAARIPPAVGALVVLLLTLRLGRRAWGRTDVGLAAAALLLTNFQFWQRAQWVACDMPLVAFSWVAITLWREALFESDAAGMRPGAKVALGWLAASLGVMTKGLALFWALFWLVGEAWARRSWRPLRRLVQPAGLALFVGPLALWLGMYAAQAGPDALREAVFHQTVDRYVSAWNLVKPWYFYAHQLPVNLLPWTVLVPLAAVWLWRRRGGRGGEDSEAVAGLAALAFVAIAVAFFSMSSGKRGVYLLPAQPALALLLARGALDLGRRGDVGRRARAAAWAALVALGLVPAAALPWIIASGRSRGVAQIVATAGTGWVLPIALGGAVLAVAAAMAAGTSLRGGDSRRALGAAVAGAAVLLATVGWFGGLAANRHQNAGPFGERVAEVVPPDACIAIARGKFELFLYYANRRGVEWERPEQLADELDGGSCRFALMLETEWDGIAGRPFARGLVPRVTGLVSGERYVLVGPPGDAAGGAISALPTCSRRTGSCAGLPRRALS